MAAMLRLFWFLPMMAAVLLAGGCAPDNAQGKKPGDGPDDGPIVLAASSLQGALEEAAQQWTAQGHPRPILSFSATPALARQIANGAPADLVITADAQWMDWLEERDFLREGTRRDLLGNRLVLVRPLGGPRTTLDTLAPGQRLALAEPGSVPAGRYAKAALVALGHWDEVAGKVVPAENVRAALALAERGEVELAIVYASDAKASPRVEIAGQLPPESHPPIRYPLALVAASDHEDGAAFAAYLASAQAMAIFAEYGFAPPP